MPDLIWLRTFWFKHSDCILNHDRMHPLNPIPSLSFPSRKHRDDIKFYVKVNRLGLKYIQFRANWIYNFLVFIFSFILTHPSLILDTDDTKFRRCKFICKYFELLFGLHDAHCTCAVMNVAIWGIFVK